MFKAIEKGFNNLSNAVQGVVRGTVVGNAATGGDGWNIGGGGGESTETTTQQNLPDWAIPAAMGTLSMGDYYTMNPNYRPSTLNRDYSGIRGYNAEGQPNSQVGGFGLSPMPAQPQPQPQPERGAGIPTGGLFGSGLFGGVKGQVAIPTSGLFGGGFGGVKGQVSGQSPMPAQTTGQNRMTNAWSPEDGPARSTLLPDGSIDTSQYGTGLKMDEPFFETGRGPGRSVAQPMPAQRPLQSPLNWNQPTGRGPGRSTATATKSTIDPNDSSNLNLTPFPAYDRQRFAAPGQNTLRGEGILAGRYDQRFGEGGTDPFADAVAAAKEAAKYESEYDPAELKLQGPTANTYENVLSGFRNVNQGMRSDTYGNANEGLLGEQDYTTGRSFQDRVGNFMNPYTDQVVNRSLQDINRARQMADLSTMGGAAKSGAFGGSREALMRAENTRNALDQAARTSGELRSAGFNTAANLAQQEELQRLGLTASDRQNLRGYQSAGNLQGQSLTAADLQNVRGLQSQGALAAQGYQAEGALNAQNLGAQSNRDVMNYANQLQMQGNQIAADQARLEEQFRQGAGALNLQAAGVLGDLAQAGIADERQRIADMLASGQAGDARNQQDLDFIYGEFDRELAYPGQQIDLRNAAISPATGSIVTTTQPRYEQNPLVSAIGAGVGAYGLTGNPYLALLAGGAGLLS